MARRGSSIPIYTVTVSFQFAVRATSDAWSRVIDFNFPVSLCYDFYVVIGVFPFRIMGNPRRAHFVLFYDFRFENVITRLIRLK